VFEAFTDILLVTWDATLANPLPTPVFEELTSQPGPRAALYRDSCEGMLKRLEEAGYEAEVLIPDTLTMAVTLRPGLIVASERHHVAVELRGSMSRGQTITDHRNWVRQTPNMECVTEAEIGGMADLFRQFVAPV